MRWRSTAYWLLSNKLVLRELACYYATVEITAVFHMANNTHTRTSEGDERRNGGGGSYLSLITITETILSQCFELIWKFTIEIKIQHFHFKRLHCVLTTNTYIKICGIQSDHLFQRIIIQIVNVFHVM